MIDFFFYYSCFGIHLLSILKISKFENYWITCYFLNNKYRDLPKMTPILEKKTTKKHILKKKYKHIEMSLIKLNKKTNKLKKDYDKD